MFKKRSEIVDGSLLEDLDLHQLKYAWSHGVGHSNTLPFVFELVKLIKPQISVIIGTGDGLIPRVIREAQIASGVVDSKTYLIDLGSTMGAMPERIHDTNSLFRTLYPEIIVFKGHSVPEGLYFTKQEIGEINLLWIDGDHSYKGSRKDFDNFSQLVTEDGLIFLHDTAPNGAGNAQPSWCGVDRTIEYIQKYRREFELVNFAPTNKLKLGAGLAVVKKKLGQIKNLDSISFINNTTKVVDKNWDYLHTKQFLLRQKFLASFLNDSEFVLDVGCYPSTVGSYLNHNRYLAVDPLYPIENDNIRNCRLDELKFNMSCNYDLVLLGLDMPVSETLCEYCKCAKKIIIEYATCYSPSADNFNYIMGFTKKQIMYDFSMNFSNIPVVVDTKKSHPARYNRRVVVLEQED